MSSQTWSRQRCLSSQKVLSIKEKIDIKTSSKLENYTHQKKPSTKLEGKLQIRKIYS